MIKADEIRKINPKEFRYLAMDNGGEVFAYDYKPDGHKDGFWRRGRGECFCLGKVDVEEFQGKNWKDCLIEFKLDYSDMIGCVGWFWDDEPDVKTLGVLSEIYMNRYYTNLGTWRFKNFRPAKPDELKFYEEK